MRPEKQFLVDEVSRHLAKSNYVYLANYSRITVEETASLRDVLSKEGAEFHVVKNSILNVAAHSRNLPDLSEKLTGPIAIIVGGRNPSGVAKALQKFFKDKQKVELKGGAIGARALTPAEIDVLANLPGLEVLRAQLLGLLKQPGSRVVQVLSGVPRAFVQVLKAKSEQGAAA